MSFAIQVRIGLCIRNIGMFQNQLILVDTDIYSEDSGIL